MLNIKSEYQDGVSAKYWIKSSQVLLNGCQAVYEGYYNIILTYLSAVNFVKLANVVSS